MTQKILNIDELASVSEKVVVIDGISHTMVETSVQTYIDRVKRTRGLDPNLPVEAQIEETVNLLHELFPTLTVVRMKRMSIVALDRFLAFAMAPPEDIAKAVEATAAAQGVVATSAEGNAEQPSQ